MDSPNKKKLGAIVEEDQGVFSLSLMEQLATGAFYIQHSPIWMDTSTTASVEEMEGIKRSTSDPS